jgi:hypothetical protein
MASVLTEPRTYRSGVRLRHRGPGRPRRLPGTVVLGVAALSVTAVLCVAVSAPSVVRVPSVLGFLCIAPGCAFVTVVGGRREPGLIIGLSLATVAVVAQSMLWLGAWSPAAFFYALAAACLLGLASAAARSVTTATVDALGPGRRVRPRNGLGLGRAVRRLIGRLSWTTAFHAGVLAGALLLWALALAGAQLGRMAGLGLLDALPVSYFIAFALLLDGFAFAAGSKDLNPRLLGAYVFALILVLHGTTAILYSEPRYAWVYKHLGVINLIAATGHADRQIDIYNNWPAFFAANAWLSRTAGIAPIAYAGWAQVFFNIVNVVALRFALRAFTRDERLLWTAALFFVVGNWVGQDYLAPQAFAFAVALVVLGLVIRSGYAPTGGLLKRGSDARRRRLLSAKRWSPTRADALPPPPLSPPAAITAGGICVLAVVTSHQLSPLMLIADVAALALVARRTPLWVPAVIAAIEVWWLALAWPFLSSHFSLFDFGSGAGTGVTRDLAAALPGASLSLYAPAVVMALMLGLALLGALRRRREGRRNLVLGCLIAAPVAVVVFQSYGGEGPYRAYLFALPWLAFLAATACVSRQHHAGPVRMRPGRLLLATATVGACLLVAYFGQELVNHIPSADVQAATWYELHAPAGSLRIDLAPNAPDRLTARYPLVSLADPPTLLTLREFTGHRLGARDLPHLEAYIRRHEPYANRRGDHPVYVVLTQGQENYGRLNGLIPAGSVAGLTAALKRSPDFRLVFSRPTAWIFHYVPGSPQPHHRRTRS